MKNRNIGVTYPIHVLYRIHERKNVIYFIPPYIIKNNLFHICSFSNIIFSITISLITNDHSLQTLFKQLQPFSMTIIEAKWILAIKSNLRKENSLKIVNPIKWVMIKVLTKDVSLITSTIHPHSLKTFTLPSTLFVIHVLYSKIQSINHTRSPKMTREFNFYQ